MKNEADPGSIGRAFEIALAAHQGQTDQSGEPYLLHPVRVMLRLGAADRPGDLTAARIVALLHDVVEDSTVSLDALRGAGFSGDVIAAVAALTRGQSETYPEFIERLSPNALARRVKLADLADNLDPARAARLPAEKHYLLDRYRRAVERLGGR